MANMSKIDIESINMEHYEPGEATTRAIVDLDERYAKDKSDHLTTTKMAQTNVLMSAVRCNPTQETKRNIALIQRFLSYYTLDQQNAEDNTNIILSDDVNPELFKESLWLIKLLHEKCKQERTIFVIGSTEDLLHKFDEFYETKGSEIVDALKQEHPDELFDDVIKIHGCFNTEKERLKLMSNIPEQSYFDIARGPTGSWMPVAPRRQQIGDLELAETRMNDIIKGRKHEREKSELERKKRVEDAKQMEAERKRRYDAKNKLITYLDSMFKELDMTVPAAAEGQA